MPTTPSLRPRPGSNVIFLLTTTGVRTRHLTDRLPITFTSTLSRSRRLHNPRSCTYPDREICLNLWGHLSVRHGSALAYLCAGPGGSGRGAPSERCDIGVARPTTAGEEQRDRRLQYRADR